jgi:uncharacterized protein YecT (DUF1311 family)
MWRSASFELPGGAGTDCPARSNSQFVYDGRVPFHVLAFFGLVASSATDASVTCQPEEVVWEGGCFDRYEWTTNEKSCPDGVILIPEGESQPRCTPCDEVLPQQPMNYCAGLRASRADAKLIKIYRALVRDFPLRSSELQEMERAWIKNRDGDCDEASESEEGGSLAPMVYSDCAYEKTLKRIVELEAIRRRWSKP